jgi:two-component system CheB/CheR fusion protein
VTGDAARLTQVVSNLLHNAVKFTDAGGRVTVRLAEADGTAALTVADTGVGIAPEVLPNLFDVFSQGDATLERSKGGLGLGLSVVKGLVELHGGRVEAASAGRGRGAAFTVRLALDGGATAQPVRTPDPGPAVRRPLKVLVVEDNRDTADSLRLLLTAGPGHEVAVAYSGPEGVEQARRSPPEVVLCDLGLPGLSGFEVARALRADPATAGAFLVCVSGYGQPEDRRRALEAGFNEMLIKPVDYDALVRLLARRGR